MLDCEKNVAVREVKGLIFIEPLVVVAGIAALMAILFRFATARGPPFPSQTTTPSTENGRMHVPLILAGKKSTVGRAAAIMRSIQTMKTCVGYSGVSGGSSAIDGNSHYAKSI